MAKLKFFFPKGVYPEDYKPPIAGFDYIPELTYLLETGDISVISKSSGRQVLELSNGLTVVLSGNGFSFDSDGFLRGGTVTRLQVMLSDGKSLLQDLTQIAWAARGENLFSNFDMSKLLARDDVLSGGRGHDELKDYAGDDVVSGGRGEDTIWGNKGRDSYDGGKGDDQLGFDVGPRAVTLDAQKGTAIDPWGDKDTFKNFEWFSGTKFADVMKGSTKDEFFRTMEGRDLIDGRGGSDWIRYDRDERNGGARGVKVDLDAGTGRDGFGDLDKLIDIENVRGTQNRDKIYGDRANNTFLAYGGRDVLAGNGGADTLFGGERSDHFVFRDVSDSTTKAKGRDTIGDFLLRQNDKIVLREIDANEDIGGNQAFAFIGTKAFGDHAGQLRYETTRADTYVFADVDGDGRADFSIHLEGKLKLTASDFIL